MIQTKEAQTLQRCGSVFETFTCEREAGHDGKCGAVLSVDDEGRCDEAVTWEKGDIARRSPEGYPLTETGEIDIPAMTDQQLPDFWDEIDARQRMMNDLFNGYKNGARSEIEVRIRKRRESNPKAVAIPHKSLVVEMQDEFTRYQFNEQLLPDVARILADDEFAKIAKFVPEFKPDPIPAHWDIKPTASSTVKSLIERYDGTPEGDLLKKFMWRDKTGEKLVIEHRKGSAKNVTPSGDR